MKLFLRLTLVGFLTTTVLAAADLPALRKQGTATQLIVDGKPFLVRGGELSNSHGEPNYLRPFWPKLKALNLNAVVAPVYWDVIEPTEGKFDFASVDSLLTDARAHDLRLVLCVQDAQSTSARGGRRPRLIDHRKTSIRRL